MKLSFKERFSYGLGDLASNFVFMAFTSFVVFFYTDGALIKASVVGYIILVSKIFDALSDAIMGIAVDRTKSKYGKARPWLIRMAIPFAISAVIAFFVPFEGQIAKIVYAFITYNIVMLVYTAINIPYGVLSAKMSEDQIERGILGVFRNTGAMIGMVIVSVAVPLLYPILGGGDTSQDVQPASVLRQGFPILFAILGVVGAIFFVLTFLGTKERINVDEKKISLKIGLVSLFRNKNWALMFGVQLSTWITNSMKAASATYFAIYFLNNKDYIQLLIITGYLPGVITMIFLAPMMYRKLGKRTASLISFVVVLIISILQFIFVKDASDTTLLFTLSVISGLAMGPAMGAEFALIADCIEYGEWKTGTRIEGLTYSAASLGGKLGSGIGTLILGLLLTSYGHVPNALTQSTATLNGYKIIYLGLPIISTALVVILLYLYDVDKLWPTIMKDLKKRRGSAVVE